MAIWVLAPWEGVTLGERLLSRSDVAELLCIPPRMVTEWAKRGLIPSVLLPTGERRYRPAEIHLKMRELEIENHGHQYQWDQEQVEEPVNDL